MNSDQHLKKQFAFADFVFLSWKTRNETR